MAHFGWTYLSRDALRKAEAQLSGASEDVRDEVGFLLLHQRYADRFFPGTSVLHTRLRYVLFVPWIYQRLWEAPPKGDFGRALADLETRLVGRLKDANEEGIIGGRLHPKHSAQPPSAVYWTALAKWRILRMPEGRSNQLSRAQVHQFIRRASRVSRDDDGRPLQDLEFPFVGLPSAPADWDGDGPLSFNLGKREKDFLHARLADVSSPMHPHRPSLLSRLAEQRMALPDHAWGEAALAVAADDRDALRRAGQAAALAAVGRAVYAALLERRVGPSNAGLSHADKLEKALENFARRAHRLDLAAMAEDVGALPGVVQRVLKETHSWLVSGAGDPELLFDAYAAAEERRKGPLARLPPTLNGARRRGEWDRDHHPEPTELHYRWKRVRQLVEDLHA
ncbi:DUF6361 family protein [Falsiroseomonas sp. HW251]|uniref:DUF6361 family protein n=1 Tax=Falsiroseomonas sp. HW251 TaxID=3390998 RepID=UPI003D3159F0